MQYYPRKRGLLLKAGDERVEWTFNTSYEARPPFSASYAVMEEDTPIK